MEPSLGSAFMADYINRFVADEKTWSETLARDSNATLPKRLRDRAVHATALARLGEDYQRSPQTVCHGDTHLGNLYVEADGRPGFYDAYPSRSPWCHDVAYHIVAALDIGDRRDWEAALLAHYLIALKGNGVSNAPDFPEAWEAYKRGIAWGLFVFLVNESQFQSDLINGAYLVRFCDAALNHDTYRRLGAL
jgi:aminoglycoside phosphotransferase (APT) family kinase protein